MVLNWLHKPQEKFNISNEILENNKWENWNMCGRAIESFRNPAIRERFLVLKRTRNLF